VKDICVPSSSTKCTSMNLSTPIHNYMTPLKAAQPQKKPERRATIIEDVEGEDERKMNEKEKARGPAILKDVEDEHEKKIDEKEMWKLKMKEQT